MGGLVEEFVTKHLPEVDIDFLTGLCEDYETEVAAEKADKKPELLQLHALWTTSIAEQDIITLNRKSSCEMWLIIFDFAYQKRLIIIDFCISKTVIIIWDLVMSI